MRFYSKNTDAIVDIHVIDENGVDWAMDFFNAGTLTYNEELEAFAVDDADTYIDYAKDWEWGEGDFEGEDCEERQVIVEEKRVTRSWKVYGADGHRQRESFNESYKYDFSDDHKGVRIIEVINSDRTGTNDYTIVKITRNTYSECEDEFFGQLYDGIFENSRVGRYEEI